MTNPSVFPTGRFAQLHLLTSYPPSNLNRDDTGRPKTATMGGSLRLRVSSQSLKRWWRTSDIFSAAFPDGLGVLTRTLGQEIIKTVTESGVGKDKASEWAGTIIATLEKKTKAAEEEGDDDAGDADPASGRKPSKREKKRKETAESGHQLRLGPRELEAVRHLASTLAKRKTAPTTIELDALRAPRHGGVDIAMFGRMLADNTDLNVEAAIQVAHAITVHEVAIEDDYFTAVDDLNKDRDETGAGHVGEAQFGAGVFYSYICADREQLVHNLDGDAGAAQKALAALLEAACCVSPRGKQNSFASRAYASYALVEKGDRQPRSLSVAFLDPIRRGDYVAEAVRRMGDTRKAMDAAYGPCAREHLAMDVAAGKVTLEELKGFIAR